MNDTFSYIARCQCGCGGIMFATIDNQRHQRKVAKDVAAVIRDGFSVERVPSEVVRTDPWGCQKPAGNPSQQLDLFTGNE